MADPDPVYIGKLAFNFSLLTTMTMVVTPLFFIFTDAPAEHIISFLPVLALGVIGLSGATTLVAAIISRASVKGALFAVLSFPILMPLLIALVAATEKVFGGSGLGEALAELQFLFAYAVVMITASLLLFKFVWQD